MSEPGKPAAAWAAPDDNAERRLPPALTRWHQPVFLLFLLICAANLALVALPAPARTSGRWMEGVFLFFAAATTLLGLSRRLPPQNVLLLAALIGGLSAGLTAVGAVVGVPFGPLVWVVILITGRGVAQLILRPRRRTSYYGFWLIGLAGLLAVIFNWGLEPLAVPGRHTTPWFHFLAGFAVVVALLVYTVPWWINKQSNWQPVDYHPLAVWWAMNLWLVAGNVAHYFWPEVIVSLVLNGVVTAFAVRGARQPK